MKEKRKRPPRNGENSLGNFFKQHSKAIQVERFKNRYSDGGGGRLVTSS